MCFMGYDEINIKKTSELITTENYLMCLYFDGVVGKWSPASRLFTQPFIQAQVKENIKAPRHWPLCGEFTGNWRIPRTKDQ